VQERGGDKHAEKDSTEKETSYDVAKKNSIRAMETRNTHTKKCKLRATTLVKTRVKPPAVSVFHDSAVSFFPLFEYISYQRCNV